MDALISCVETQISNSKHVMVASANSRRSAAACTTLIVRFRTGMWGFAAFASPVDATADSWGGTKYRLRRSSSRRNRVAISVALRARLSSVQGHWPSR